MLQLQQHRYRSPSPFLSRSRSHFGNYVLCYVVAGGSSLTAHPLFSLGLSSHTVSRVRNINYLQHISIHTYPLYASNVQRARVRVMPNSSSKQAKLCNVLDALKSHSNQIVSCFFRPRAVCVCVCSLNGRCAGHMGEIDGRWLHVCGATSCN